MGALALGTGLAAALLGPGGGSAASHPAPRPGALGPGVTQRAAPATEPAHTPIAPGAEPAAPKPAEIRAILGPATETLEETAPIALHGFVLDEAGRSVAEAHVRGRVFVQHARGRDLAAGETRSDGNGRYELTMDIGPPGPALAPELALELVARAPEGGFGRARREPGQVLGGRLDVILVAPSVLEGRVVDVEGRPVQGAECWLVPMPAPDAAPRERGVLTDEGGRYRLLVEEPNWYAVAACHSAHGVGSTPSQLHLGGRPQTCPDLVLLPFASITGRVLRRDGSPLAGAAVGALLESLRDAQPTELLGAVRPHPSDFLLPTGAVEPVAGGLVRTDDEGGFALWGLRHAQYVLLVGDHAFEEPVARREIYGPFPPNSRVELEVRAPRLLVEVLDNRWQGVPSLRVLVEDEAGFRQRYRTDASGRATAILEPGPWRVTLEYGEDSYSRQNCVLRDGEDTLVQFGRLRPARPRRAEGRR